tara:strand:- start:6 stop:671 length:666 start_codon:yes stop_codon:yes gene_type:complete
MKRILVIAPHADDEVLGLGGTMSKYIDNSYQVIVLVMTNANKGNPKDYSENLINKIRKESRSANKILGIKKLIFYDYPALSLDSLKISEMAKTIKKNILKFKPQKVFIPNSEDIHLDHKHIHTACLVACRPTDNFKIKELLSYETLSETEWGKNQFSPDKYEILSKKNIQNKIRAFKKYKSQMKKKFHPRSAKGIEILSRLRGSNISVQYAEAFKIIRIIN